MSEQIYTSFAGYPVKDFSYSQASEISNCGKKFELTRIRGYAPKLESAALKFGICIEASVVAFYHGGDPVEMFRAEWQHYQNIELDYSDRDKSWKALEDKGIGMMRGFPRIAETLPLSPADEFGKKLLKPNWHRGFGLTCIADCLPHNVPEPMVVDIKTAGAKYPEDEDGKRFIGYDRQLCTYALVTGLRRVAFLVFVKTKEPTVQWLEADVNDEALADTENWLKEELDRVIARKFGRRVGFRYPVNQCLGCDVRDACLGDAAKVAENLIIRSKLTDRDFELLDAIG